MSKGPTKKQWTDLLVEGMILQKQEEEIDEVYTKYIKLAAPTSYPPIFEFDAMHGFAKAVEALYGEDAKEDVYYWLYDVPEMAKRGKVTCTYKGKEYDATDLKQYIEFLLAKDNDHG